MDHSRIILYNLLNLEDEILLRGEGLKHPENLNLILVVFSDT